MFDEFDNDIKNMIEAVLNPLDWDKKSYKFNRDEKDMHPYSIKRDKNNTIITHNILGINKEDLKITNEYENGNTFIAIRGKTRDDITEKEYSIDSRFILDERQLDLTKIKATAKNGLLYIIIPSKLEAKKENKNIEIL